MGSSIDPAITYLVGVFTNGFTGKNIYGQPLTVPPLSSLEPNVVIADGWTSNESGPWVVVGRDSWDQESQIQGSASWQYIGQERIREEYTIPGMVLVEQTGDQFQPVRARAVALFSLVSKLVWADPSLGGVLQDGEIGFASQFQLTQTDPRADRGSESGAAIAAVMTFAVDVKNNYLP